MISLLYQIIYGSHITDNYDQQAVSALVDYWLSPNAVKKDFEERRCKFVLGTVRMGTDIKFKFVLGTVGMGTDINV